MNNVTGLRLAALILLAPLCRLRAEPAAPPAARRRRRR